ncbi:unnamed protein product [Lymnaea stagnalis]|uniref:Methyltransferase type 11 domain-containing protein n=1 Tax=Lymnaea stagnalis TaxID=6523 RepID=A0AAV2H8F2_LYMST
MLEEEKMPHVGSGKNLSSQDSERRSQVVALDAVCAVCDCCHGARKLLSVLEVGAGDGRLAGEGSGELQKIMLHVSNGRPLISEMINRGFHLIDAVDSSKTKLSLLRRQALYDNYYTCSDNYNHLPMEDGVYGLVLAVGCFHQRHVPCSAISELARVTKQEGLLVLSVLQEDGLDSWAEYKSRLESTMMALHTDGIMELVARDLASNFSDHRTRIIYIFKKC